MPVRYVDKAVYDNLRPRIERDVYETDPTLANAIVEYMDYSYKFDGGIYALDPGAGSGVFGRALRDNMGTSVGVLGFELRNILPKSKHTYGEYFNNTDFLGETYFKYCMQMQLVIGNPPFKHAENFVWRAKYYLEKGGYICFLLPSQFQHSVGRGRGLFKDYRPDRIVSLMQRPNFTGPLGESLGSANTDDYILMIWRYYSSLVTVHDFLDWKPK